VIVVFYWIVRALLRPLLRWCGSTQTTGVDNLPSGGGALLASNHLSMCDSLFLPAVLRRRVTFLAKKEYFEGRGIKGRAKAAFVRGTGLVPIDRTDTDAAAAALSTGAEIVRQGRVLCLYPEGTRSPDGRLYRGRTGIARMALDTGVPIIPVAMQGTDRVLPIGKVLPTRARVRIRIGHPIDPRRFAEMDPVHGARALTDEVMDAIAALSGQAQAQKKLTITGAPPTDGR
jgi:1-acyl-sn-glycerol-3-phosphate acyltransferase